MGNGVTETKNASKCKETGNAFKMPRNRIQKVLGNCQETKNKNALKLQVFAFKNRGKPRHQVMFLKSSTKSFCKNGPFLG